jgi:hypothetical protein
MRRPFYPLELRLVLISCATETFYAMRRPFYPLELPLVLIPCAPETFYAMRRSFYPLELPLVLISCSPETFLASGEQEIFFSYKKIIVWNYRKTTVAKVCPVYRTKADDRFDDWFTVCMSCGSESY